MDRLTFVGVQDDGEHLVLESADGTQRYQVRIDNGLRNAVVRARRAQTPRSLSGRGEYGPRDIQTRFRQGATVDEIVAESGWKPERVRRYEWPILAERAHIVTAARGVVIRPLDHRSRGRKTLNDQVVAVREDWNFAEGDAQWNSWQREDGQWNVTVSVDYSQAALAQIPAGADFPARFVYNPANQTVVAGNAVAEFLFGQPLEDREPLDSAEDADTESPAEQPAEGSDDVEHAAAEAATAETATPEDEASIDAAPENETPTPAEDATPEDSAAESEDPEDPTLDFPEPTAHLRAVADEETTPTEDLLDELESRRGTRKGSDPSSDERVAGLTQRLPREGNGGSSSSQRGRSRSGRPSVPSWDDIVFGNHKPKE